LRFGDYDFNKVIDREIKTWPEERRGFITAGPGMKALNESIGFPYGGVYSVENSISLVKDMKILLVGGPLERHIREKYWWLMRQGYMAVGIQSYRSYPLWNDWEAETDSFMASLDKGMDYIMD